MEIVTSLSNSVRAGQGSQPRQAPAGRRQSESGEDPGLGAARWQQELREAVRDPAEVCELLQLPSRYLEAARQAAQKFSLFVTRSYLSRIEPGRVDDPLLRQVLPISAELDSAPGFVADPVGDGPATLQPGLIQKYSGRVLLVTTGACAIHCRYCFRREFPYAETPRGLTHWQPALEAIRGDRGIREVILSGGDPWTLVDDSLDALLTQLDQIPHIARIRIHTRLPIVLPSRVTEGLLAGLSGRRARLVCVLHANHAREIDESVASAVARLRASGCLLLNQAVLLRGVNDRLEDLTGLSERLLEVGVLPYYLHQLDRVVGASHFEVPAAQGRELVRQMTNLLPGYAVPKYVQEIPGGHAKTSMVEALSLDELGPSA